MRTATRLSIVIPAAIALLATTPLSADPFRFTFSGTGLFGGTLNGTGIFTTDGVSFVNALNGYTAQRVTGISGTFNGSNITGLSTVFGADNYYYTSGPFFVDGQGISFTTASGVAANLFITNSTSYRVNTQGAGLLTGPVIASSSAIAAAAPEPATWGMMILGFGLVGLGLRRQVRRSEVRFDAKIKRIADGAVA